MQLDLTTPKKKKLVEGSPNEEAAETPAKEAQEVASGTEKPTKVKKGGGLKAMLLKKLA